MFSRKLPQTFYKLDIFNSGIILSWPVIIVCSKFKSFLLQMDPEILARLIPQGKESVRPACKKCGYAGHLTYQCRNFIKIDPNKDIVLDVSSTSSDTEEDYTTPLTLLRDEELRAKLKEIKKKSKKSKKKHKHKRKSESDSEDESPKKKQKTSTSYKDSSSESEEDKSSKKKHKSKKKKKKHKSKHKKHKKSRSSSGSDSD